MEPVEVFGDPDVDGWSRAAISGARAGSHAHQLVDAVALADQRATRVTLNKRENALYIQSHEGQFNFQMPFQSMSSVDVKEELNDMKAAV